MDYEKKYKEALKVIGSLYNTVKYLSNSDALLTCQTIEKAFPELCESDDERIRKGIICGMNALKEQHKETFASISINDCITWLEKQGEQILANSCKTCKDEQKPSLSEEDEKIRRELYDFITCQYGSIDDMHYHSWISWIAKRKQEPIEQDTEIRDLWVYIREWNDKFGRLPKDEDELASCIDYVMKRQKAAWSEKHIADVFEKVGLAKIVREQGNDQLTNAVQSAMIELSKLQKPADKVEPKFKPGDNIIEKDLNECGSGTIKEIKNNKYYFTSGTCIDIQEQDLWQLVKEHVEPKFKVGDWVQIDGGHVMKVLEVKKDVLCYRILNWCGNESVRKISDIDSIAHLWTIQDAKKGDILQANKCTLIFDSLTKDIDGNTVISSWYSCDTHKFYGMGPSQPDLWVTEGVVPATKEQRDLLFSKMKAAGYKWDVEKKELKKIEQKPAWSEDDERILYNVIAYVGFAAGQRGVTNDAFKEANSWLKSLKPNHWKPSEEQMKALNAINMLGELSYVGQGGLLVKLYQDLLKL